MIGDEADPLAVVSISGGKDSLATAIIAILSYGRDRVRLVNADTGHESPITTSYVTDYLPGALGLPIDVVRADFTKDFARKREWIAAHWVEDGVPPDRVARALELLVPTGIPFLDLCMMKGRFPSRKAQFCTERLKSEPLEQYILAVSRNTNLRVESWRGVRRNESQNRRDASACERSDAGYWIKRPIVAWTAAQVIDLARQAGIEQNPLYRLGMGRVGCFPCINCSKDELREIVMRFPDVVERVVEWEALVGACSKLGYSSLLHKQDWSGSIQTRAEAFEAERFEEQVKWSMTRRGGKQYDLERAIQPAECSSVYGLCE